MHMGDSLAHGDIKPDNYVITDKFGLALIDFAHSKPIREVTRKFHGTPRYNPPEMYLDRPHSMEKADIFLLGVTLFIILF